MKTIKDVEVQVEERVHGLLKELDILPDGYSCSVRFHGRSRDKKRTASFEKNWSPETDSINIHFEPNPEPRQAGSQPAAQGAGTIANASSAPVRDDPVADLVRSLDRAESRPGYNFVALKWFRDAALPSEGFPWTNVDSARQSVLREAIDRRLVLTSKVANPKSPQFPVTAIRLNRLMPEVKAILGTQEGNVPGFQPVPIRGGDLSATVLRDRR